MLRSIVSSIFLFMTVSLLVSCDVSFSGKVVAKVNGEKITTAELDEAVAKEISSQTLQGTFDNAALRRLKKETLAEIINNRIMEQRAKELSIEVYDAEVDKRFAEMKGGYENTEGAKALGNAMRDDKQWKRDLKRHLLYEKVIEKDVYGKIVISDADAKRFYDANPARYPSETRVRLSQIFVEDEKQAREIVNRLKNGEDFASIAKKESLSPDGANGGDLGFISRGVMPAPVESIAFSLPVGKVSDVVKSLYGYHVLKVLEREEIKRGEFARVRERVIADMKAAKSEMAFQSWLENLKNKSQIEVNREALEEFLSANSTAVKAKGR